MNLKNYLLVYNSRGKNDDDDVDQFVDTLQKSSKAYGIKVDQPIFLTVKTTKFQDWRKVIETDI